MERRKRTNFASGICLILLGLLLLAFRIAPGLSTWFNLTFEWPMIIVLSGLGLLVLGLVTATPDMAVPASIVAGVGGILYYQNATGDWLSWSYAWALIPGFVGVGLVLSGLIKGNKREILDGLQNILVSAVLFLIFGSLLGNLFSSYPLGQYWPALLIILGAFLFIRALLSPKR
jgi:hypothetical protein